MKVSKKCSQKLGKVMEEVGEFEQNLRELLSSLLEFIKMFKFFQT